MTSCNKLIDILKNPVCQDRCHPSKIDFLAEAKALGYEVVLVFIHLQMDELNQVRVAQRVSEGGHKVPVEKIISRIPRTLQHIQPSSDSQYQSST